MHIPIIWIFILLFGACGFGFLAGYFIQSVFRNNEREYIEYLEFQLNEKDERMEGLFKRIRIAEAELHGL